MLKAVNSTLDSVRAYTFRKGDDDQKQGDDAPNWRPAIYASAVGLSTLATLYAARQYYRARIHDNIPMVAIHDFASFGGHLPKMKSFEENGGYYPWIYQENKRMGFPRVLCLSVPTQNFVFLNDPKLVKFVLDTHFEDTAKSEKFIEDYEPLLGHGIFAGILYFPT